jgi:hypothetical protein
MLNKKTLLLFFLKLVLFCGILAAPFSYYDEVYGNFFRACGKKIFEHFRDDGFVLFAEGKTKDITEVVIGNYNVRNPDNTAKAFQFEVNTRYLGYLPTILFISLVLASPVSWRRRLVALLIGLTLVTIAVMFKQWIELLAVSNKHEWLKLINFSPGKLKLLGYAYNGVSRAASAMLYFVVALWLLVTFRIDDLKPNAKPAKGQSKMPVRK